MKKDRILKRGSCCDEKVVVLGLNDLLCVLMYDEEQCQDVVRQWKSL